MPTDAQIVTRLNEQAAREAKAAHFYMDGANWCAYNGYLGSARFCEASAQEEWTHFWLFEHLVRDIYQVEPAIPAVPEMKRPYGSLLEFFQQVLELEQTVTESLEALTEETRPRIHAELVPMLHGQNEGESQLTDFIRMLERAGEDPSAIFMVDKVIRKATP